MAIRAVPGYGAQGAKNTINSPSWIEQPIAPIKKTGTASLASAIAATPKTTAAPAAQLTAGAIGRGGASPLSTTTTVTPLQVYQDQILSDPGSVGAQGQYDANVNNLALARRDAIQKAILNAGWDPSSGLTGGLASYASDVDPATIAQAQQNPMSQRAQLQKQLSDAQSNLPYDLAASGADRSGAFAINQSQLGQQYDTASYQGLQDLLGSIGGAVNQYATGFNSAQAQLAAAREAVANRLAQNAGYSQTVTTNGGDDGSGDGSYDPTQGGTSQINQSLYAPATTQAVAKVIKALGSGAKKSPYYYQNLKNIMAG